MSSNDQISEAAKAFQRSVAAERVAHGYLVVGSPRGQGLNFAMESLRLLFCEAGDKPCRECPACRQIMERSHPDVHWVEPEKKSRIISVDQIRELNRRIAQKSFEGGWKAAVILYADRLKEGAANAFLKTLEEPPGKAILLMLTDVPQALLPTIVSRCQRISLEGTDISVAQPWMDELLQVLKNEASKDPMEAMRLGQQLKAIVEAERTRIREENRDSDGDVESEVAHARTESKARETRSEIIRRVLFWKRDVLFASLSLSDTLLHFPDHVDTIHAHAEKLTFRQALNGLKRVEDAVRQLDRNMPEDAVLEGLFMR